MSVRVMRGAAALVVGLVAAVALAAGRTPTTFVFCAPGSPGTTEEAQGAMDAFAAAVARQANLPAGAIVATYAAAEDAGVTRLRERDAAVGFVSVPFFLKHEKPLGLRATELQPVMQGGATERWSLVARRGRVSGPAALDGFTILSTAGFAPAFVRGPGIGGFGPLPPTVKIASTSAVLSALRRAAAGDPVAVLLDGAQGAALGKLAFASDLEVVARSEPLPIGVVAIVDGRVAPPAWSRIAAALRELPGAPQGAAALAGIRLERFVPLDEPSLALARKRFAEAAR